MFVEVVVDEFFFVHDEEANDLKRLRVFEKRACSSSLLSRNWKVFWYRWLVS